MSDICKRPMKGLLISDIKLTLDEVVGHGRPERRGRRLVSVLLEAVGEREVAAAAVGKAAEHRHR